MDPSTIWRHRTAVPSLAPHPGVAIEIDEHAAAGE
jgi:hypothetical protein